MRHSEIIRAQNFYKTDDVSIFSPFFKLWAKISPDRFSPQERLQRVFGSIFRALFIDGIQYWVT